MRTLVIAAVAEEGDVDPTRALGEFSARRFGRSRRVIRLAHDDGVLPATRRRCLFARAALAPQKVHRRK
jgi:hypothetical protein